MGISPKRKRLKNGQAHLKILHAYVRKYGEYPCRECDADAAINRGHDEWCGIGRALKAARE